MMFLIFSTFFFHFLENIPLLYCCCSFFLVANEYCDKSFVGLDSPGLLEPIVGECTANRHESFDTLV